MAKDKIRVRYAPSPTGHLHIGNARTALFNYLFARHNKGTFVLRIEDTDTKRNIADGERSQMENLHWLGIDWDEGPDKPGEYGPYRQSERKGIYQPLIQELLDKDLAYESFMTEDELNEQREAQKARGEAPRYEYEYEGMTKEEIKAIEEAYAKTETPVVSNNSAHRWTPDVPMVVPEINAEHFEVIADQKKRLGTTRGFIAVKPNCSIQSYAPCLAAWKEFGPKEVVATTYQAISGAGKTFKDWPEMVGNIIPFIGGEEEKSEQEPLRVLGKVENGQIVKAELPKITCQCIRVPVLNGHTAAVFINFEKKPTKEQLIEKLVNFKGFPQEANLPSAPKQFIQYLEEDNRPQVTQDVNYENGMGVSIGRLREDSMFDYKFVGLSHNTVRGAAGGAVLCAEALTAKGYIQAK